MPEAPTKLLVLLQNAYDKGGLAQGWTPGVWRRELLTSRTGQRLQIAIGRETTWRRDGIHIANCCPGIARGPSEKLPVCTRHTRAAIRRVRPAAILACGWHAEDVAAVVWDGPLFAIPHPAYRLLTDGLLARCANVIGWWRLRLEYGHESPFPLLNVEVPRLALRQRRGSVEFESLGIPSPSATRGA